MTWKDCRRKVFEYFTGHQSPTAILPGYFLDELKVWNAKNSYAVNADPIYHHALKPILLLKLGELPISVRKELFTSRGKIVAADQMEAHLATFGINLDRNYILQMAIAEIYRRNDSPSDAYERLEAEISGAQEFYTHQNQETLRSLEDDLTDRVAKNEVTTWLSNNKSPEYRIRIDRHKNVVQMPNGKIYTIAKKPWNGELVIEVPAENVIGDSYSEHLKDQDYSSKRIDGVFLPDGRFRTTALSSWARSRVFNKDGKCLVTITPSRDGHIYTESHFDVISQVRASWFNRYWDSLSGEEKDALREKAELSPYEVMADIYKRFSRRLPPF